MIPKPIKSLFKIALLSALPHSLYAAEGDPYTWPTYPAELNYNFANSGLTFKKPTQDAPGECIQKAKNEGGVYYGDYWAFYHGANKNDLVTEASILPMIERFDQDFAFITDTMGWPRDSRVKNGYYSAIYLYGSDACTGSNDSSEKGGWQSYIDGYPAVAASYYPVYSFDPSCPYSDKVSQQNGMVHEGIHAILTNLGASHVHWFQEGGNTWLQQEMEVRRSSAKQHHGMGFLNAGNLIAPFVPIESYSGWLLDGSFGGPGAQGVDAGGKCNWRNVLGGVQYGNLFPTFLGLWVAEGAVPWIWVNIPNGNGKYILESMAAAVGGDHVRSIIMEYRAKLALLDMKWWSEEMRTLLNQNVGSSIGCEFNPCAVEGVEKWTVSPYVVTTESGGILTPEARTTPGWSGANVIPLTVQPGAMEVQVSLLEASQSMGLQIAYRATDGTPIYSAPTFGNNTATLQLQKAPQSNVVFAIVTNTDFTYEGETTRTTHHNYRLQINSGISGKADPHTRWYNNFEINYDWENAKIVIGGVSSSTEISSSVEESSSSTSSSSEIKSATLKQSVSLPVSENYSGVLVKLNFAQIAETLGIHESEITASMIQGLNANGSVYDGNTAQGDAGHWFAPNGDVVNYSEQSSTIYAEWTLASQSVLIGHFPNRVLDGEVYLIRQKVSSEDAQVILEFEISIVNDNPVNQWTQPNKNLGIKFQNGVIKANYQISKAGKVKIGIYTGYGALIKNVVNEHHEVGSYAKEINLKSLNLPLGVYLIKLSSPGHSETRPSISSYK